MAAPRLQEVFLDRFSQNNFDVKYYAEEVLKSGDTSEVLSSIVEGIEGIDGDIRKEVNEKTEDLLAVLTNLSDVESFVRSMESRVQDLVSSSLRLTEKINQQNDKMCNKLLMLQRIQQTCESLRLCVRVLTLSRRLESYTQQGSKELVKAAQTLSELDLLLSSPDLNGIDVVDKERLSVCNSREEVMKHAKSGLAQGLEAENATQTAMSLQVFYHLSCLESSLYEYTTGVITGLRSNAATWLDVSALSSSTDKSEKIKTTGPGRVAGLPTVQGSVASFRVKLWQAVEKFLHDIAEHSQQVENLYKILSKKRDFTSDQTYLDVVRNYQTQRNSEVYPLRIAYYLSAITSLLMDVFERTAQSSPYAKQAFEAEYPKLLKLMLSCTGQCRNLIEMASSEESAGANFDDLFIAVVNPFETAYLCRSLSALFDPIEVLVGESQQSPRMISQTNMIAPSDLANIVRLIQSELAISSFDAALCVKVMRNVVKAINLLLVRLEKMTITGGDASQTLGPLTAGQVTNFAIADVAWSLDSSLAQVKANCPNLPAEALAKLDVSRQSAATLALNTLAPLLESLSESFSAIVESMHQEPFDGISAAGENSAYAKELSSFLKRIAADYLSTFKNRQLQSVFCQKLGNYCVETWLWNASLIKPISNEGTKRLIADWRLIQSTLVNLSFVETATFGIISPKSPSHQLVEVADKLCSECLSEEDLQAFATKCQSNKALLPAALALHFLFSRGPAELKMPHENSCWSIGRYIRYILQHKAEVDRLHMIGAALEAHLQYVRNRGEKEFTPAYMIAVSWLKDAMSEHVTNH